MIKSQARVKAQKYLDGDGVNMDPDKAVQILQQGALEGDLSCYLDLAECYFDGVPEEDNDKAIHFLKTGANAGNGKCCALLSELFTNGQLDFSNEDVVKPNPQTSFEWATLGAEKNDPACLIKMAHYHLSSGDHNKAEVFAKKCLDLFEEEARDYEEDELDEIHGLAQKLLKDIQ